MLERMYTGDDGIAHFEDMEFPLGPDGRSQREVVKSLTFVQQQPGYTSPLHPMSQRAYCITVQGGGELSNGHGEVRIVGPDIREFLFEHVAAFDGQIAAWKNISLMSHKQNAQTGEAAS